MKVHFLFFSFAVLGPSFIENDKLIVVGGLSYICEVGQSSESGGSRG